MEHPKECSDCAAYDAARLAILELPALVGELVEEQLGWPARRSVVEHARQTANVNLGDHVNVARVHVNVGRTTP